MWPLELALATVSRAGRNERKNPFKRYCCSAHWGWGCGGSWKELEKGENVFGGLGNGSVGDS